MLFVHRAGQADHSKTTGYGPDNTEEAHNCSPLHGDHHDRQDNCQKLNDVNAILPKSCPQPEHAAQVLDAENYHHSDVEREPIILLLVASKHEVYCHGDIYDHCRDHNKLSDPVLHEAAGLCSEVNDNVVIIENLSALGGDLHTFCFGGVAHRLSMSLDQSYVGASHVSQQVVRWVAVLLLQELQTFNQDLALHGGQILSRLAK
mmetsp:Transcript_25691/g.66086  ORF Transcript_25691/g.66086 Transcript_25691/m.66086 type:complete len:204 (-) Transcript_25691:194-805(-)